MRRLIRKATYITRYNPRLPKARENCALLRRNVTHATIPLPVSDVPSLAAQSQAQPGRRLPWRRQMLLEIPEASDSHFRWLLTFFDSPNPLIKLQWPSWRGGSWVLADQHFNFCQRHCAHEYYKDLAKRSQSQLSRSTIPSRQIDNFWAAYYTTRRDVARIMLPMWWHTSNLNIIIFLLKGAVREHAKHPIMQKIHVLSIHIVNELYKLTQELAEVAASLKFYSAERYTPGYSSHWMKITEVTTNYRIAAAKTRFTNKEERGFVKYRSGSQLFSGAFNEQLQHLHNVRKAQGELWAAHRPEMAFVRLFDAHAVTWPAESLHRFVAAYIELQKTDHTKNFNLLDVFVYSTAQIPKNYQQSRWLFWRRAAQTFAKLVLSRAELFVLNWDFYAFRLHIALTRPELVTADAITIARRGYTRMQTQYKAQRFLADAMELAIYHRIDIIEVKEEASLRDISLPKVISERMAKLNRNERHVAGYQTLEDTAVSAPRRQRRHEKHERVRHHREPGSSAVVSGDILNVLRAAGY